MDNTCLEPARSTTSVTPAGPLITRLRLTGRNAVTIVTALAIGVLLCAWLTVAAGAVVVVLLPLLSPTTLLVRACCDAERRWLADRTGQVVRPSYRPLTGSMAQRAVTLLSDPASWRDAVWMLWQSVLGWMMAALPVSLLLGSVFYLTYPLWYAVTPSPVFRDPFGSWSELHSVAQACALIPVSLVCLGLWYLLTPRLARAQAAVGRRLLSSPGVAGGSAGR